MGERASGGFEALFKQAASQPDATATPSDIYKDKPSQAEPVNKPANPGKMPKPHYHNHRDRLRDKFTRRGADAFDDYELLELVLFQALPRIDTKPIAKQLLAEFGSLAEVVAAPDSRIASHRNTLAGQLIAEAAIRRARPS